jgi:hypothetical protein
MNLSDNFQLSNLPEGEIIRYMDSLVPHVLGLVMRRNQDLPPGESRMAAAHWDMHVIALCLIALANRLNLAETPDEFMTWLGKHAETWATSRSDAAKIEGELKRLWTKKKKKN